MDDFAICPYNTSHRMLKLRLQHHILRCRQNYNGPEMKPCPFNATHIVLLKDYTQHVLACGDARLIEGHKYRDNLQAHGTLGPTRFHFPILQDDNWDSPVQHTQINTYSNASSDTSVIDTNGSDDEEYCPDYDEDEEPLQGYFYNKRNSGDQQRSSETKNKGECLEGASTYSEKTDKGAMENKDEDATTGSLNGLDAPPKNRLLRLLEKLAKEKMTD